MLNFLFIMFIIWYFTREHSVRRGGCWTNTPPKDCPTERPTSWKK